MYLHARVFVSFSVFLYLLVLAYPSAHVRVSSVDNGYRSSHAQVVLEYIFDRRRRKKKINRAEEYLFYCQVSLSPC
jgi:hypothetical protein